MAQQINLFSPILLTPRRLFSAEAMLQALSVLTLGLLLLSSWSWWSTQGTKQGLSAQTLAQAQDKARLAAELALLPPQPKDTSALEQELAAARQALATRRALQAELAADAPEQRPSALLALLAETVPPPVWLSEIRRGNGRLELVGTTLQPEALRPWMAALAARPVLAGLPLRAIQVERKDESSGAGLGVDSWSFRIVSAADSNGSSNGSSSSSSRGTP